MKQSQSPVQKTRFVVSGWINQLGRIARKQHIICIIGYKFIGKSSFCALSSQYLQNNSSLKVKIQTEKQKYVCSGIISSSSTKSSSLPKIYKVDNIYLLDAPAIILPQQSSKKTTLEIQTIQGKIANQIMLKSFQKMSFILTINEAITKSKLDGLKRMVIGFIEYFKTSPLPQQLLNSVAFLFTKVPSSIDQQKMINRIVKLIPECKSHPRFHDIEALINNIIARKAIILFFKVQNQEKDRKIFPQMFSEINKIKPITLSNQIIEIAQLKINNQQAKVLKQYWGNIYIILQELKSFFMKVEDNQKDLPQFIDKTKLQIRQNITKLLVQSNIQSQTTNQNHIEQREVITLHKIHIMLVKIMKEVNSINDEQAQCDDVRLQDERNVIIKVFKIIIQYGIIDKQILDLIYDLMRLHQLIKTTLDNIQINLMSIINDIKSFFSQKQYQNLRSKLTSHIQSKRQAKYYEQMIEVLQYFQKSDKTDNNNIIDLIVQCKLQLAKDGDSSEYLKGNLDAYQKYVQNDNLQNIHNIFINIGNLLQKQKYYKQAFKLFQKVDPYKAMYCINREIDRQQKTNFQDIREYATYFIDIGLRQKCLQFCYHAGHKFNSLEQRKKIYQIIEIVSKKKGDDLKINIKSGFGQLKVQPLSKQVLEKLRTVQRQLQKKIKKSLKDTKETLQQA